MCQIQSGRPYSPEPHQTGVMGVWWRIEWIQTQECVSGRAHEVERQQDQDSLHWIPVDYIQ